MADRSLAAARLFDQDISSLAQVLEANLQYCFDHRSIFEEEYIMEIKIAVGLGCIAALVSGYSACSYVRQLNAFLQRYDFKYRKEALPSFCSHAACMMKLAHELFSGAGCPKYRQDFSALMVKILGNVRSTLAGKGEEADRLIRIFSQGLRTGWS